MEIFLGNPEIETDIPEVLLLRALVYANQPVEERLKILESFGIKTRVLRKDLEVMDSLWDNVYSQGEKHGRVQGEKLGLVKGEKLGVSQGEKNIRDQIGKELNLVHQGKITQQQFEDRMTDIFQGN